MALLFADSFEHYGVSSVSRTNMTQGAYASVGSVDGCINFARTGSRCLESRQGGTTLLAFNTLSNEIGFACGLYLNSMPLTEGQRSGFRISDEVNTSIITVVVMPNGSIEIRRGDSGATLGVSDVGLVTASAWNHFEVRVLQDNVVGEVELRLNGVVTLYLTDLDLGTVLPRFWRTFSGSTTTIVRNIDDLILWDTTGDINNTFFGPARVNVGWLESDVSGNEWSVVGAASGVEALTETQPDDDTSYITAGAVGNVSEFNFPELPPEALSIAGVYVPVMAKLAVAGIGDMKTSIVSGSAVTEGEVNQLTTAYTYRGEVFEKDPATNAPWSKAGLEAAKLRVEKVA